MMYSVYKLNKHVKLKNKIKKLKKTIRENLKILKDNTYCENIKYNEDNFKILGFKFLNKIKIH